MTLQSPKLREDRRRWQSKQPPNRPSKRELERNWLHTSASFTATLLLLSVWVLALFTREPRRCVSNALNHTGKNPILSGLTNIGISFHVGRRHRQRLLSQLANQTVVSRPSPAAQQVYAFIAKAMILGMIPVVCGILLVTLGGLLQVFGLFFSSVSA